METSLHRQLKDHFATVRGLGRKGEVEVQLDKFRIDVVRDKLLVEVQHGGLSAIRDKIRKLCNEHDVLVVKPIVVRKRLVKLTKRNGEIVSRRWSPKRGVVGDIFHDLVHFTRAFPHKRLRLQALMVEVEELRYPGHGRRRRWRKNDFVVQDQQLVEILDMVEFRNAYDLWKIIPGRLPKEFDTAELAKAMETKRWIAQRAAYAMREMGAIEETGKRGNARLYKKLPKRTVLQKQAA